MAQNLPNIQSFAASLAELHSKGLSPNGKYGFTVPTLQGTVPQFTDWTDSWEEFFSKSIRLVMENEERSQGSDPEVQQLCEATLNIVVPRLLRPLETGGRQIQPRLVHGDIWDGNVATDIATKTPIIFDATCIYAHNESKSCPPSVEIALTPNSRARSTSAYWAPDGNALCRGILRALSSLGSQRRPG